MPSPIAQHGITLDNTFDPWVAGTDKAAATGIFEAGVDICNKYAPLKYGTAATATGITCRTPAVDLSAIFAKKGTAKYSIPPPTYNGITITETGVGAITSSITLDSNGQWSSSDGQLGTWYGSTLAGVGAGYEMRATVSGGSAGVTNPAANFIGMSSPITIQFSSTGTGNRSVVIEIRPVGKTVESTGTVVLQNTIDG
jgi:hypothetical protein